MVGGEGTGWCHPPLGGALVPAELKGINVYLLSWTEDPALMAALECDCPSFVSAFSYFPD